MSQVEQKLNRYYGQFRQLKSEHYDAKVTNVLEHVRTNHLPREDLENVTQNICQLFSYLESV